MYKKLLVIAVCVGILGVGCSKSADDSFANSPAPKGSGVSTKIMGANSGAAAPKPQAAGAPTAQ